MTRDLRADVLVVGSGIAGLTAALRAARTSRVLLVTKGAIDDSATAKAQGGIAGALDPEDSPAQHAADTHIAGAGLCLEDAVRVLCQEGPARIRELIDLGVAFDRVEGDAEDPDLPYAMGLEGAHSRPRILHAGGDATGRAIEDALVRAVRRAPIEVLEQTALVDLLVIVPSSALSGPGAARVSDTPDVPAGTPCPAARDEEYQSANRGERGHGHGRGPERAPRVVGATFLGADGAPLEVRANAVVLATGGAGQLYSHTTNPEVATGDGVAAAWRAGARVADLEFVQFHPTALTGSAFLVSEAVRGEGAVLRDVEGRRFMLDIDPRAELSPRDVVARAIARVMASQHGHPVLLDATDIGRAELARRFPTIDAAVHAAGLDWASRPIPVTPAAHYAMGGIRTDLDGRASLPGLFAAGECACTGVHGANRLASNSLLEGAVFGARAGETAAVEAAGSAAGSDAESDAAPAAAFAALAAVPAAGPAWTRRDLQGLMWERVGLLRTGDRLAHAARVLDGWSAPAPSTVAAVEDRNLLHLARLTVAAARARTASAGAHHRLDDPSAAEGMAQHSPVPAPSAAPARETRPAPAARTLQEVPAC
ncbi:FAD-dependent oxidoreductase [Brachybacterium halotolerans subsp. kimchii]|uniref:L-aspartate oxidase n=1 Tax=Brachybacterium halotolerans TaxID=2795215 RepID=UPI001E567017|nr:FAD-binding protein [Brachybacterium halotolerans]UEJ81695.1 FAD-dependent oxidoreductase [Brachybacterium halotolerans subsp. kimchii]